MKQFFPSYLLIFTFFLLGCLSSCSESNEPEIRDIQYTLDRSAYYNRDTVRFIDANFSEFEEVFVSFFDEFDAQSSRELKQDSKGHYFLIDPFLEADSYSEGNYQLEVGFVDNTTQSSFTIVYPRLTLASNDTMLYHSNRLGFDSGGDTIISYEGERLLSHKWQTPTRDLIDVNGVSDFQIISITDNEIKIGVSPLWAFASISPYIAQQENRLSDQRVFVSPVAKLTTPLVNQTENFVIKAAKNSPSEPTLIINGERIIIFTRFLDDCTQYSFRSSDFSLGTYDLELEVTFDGNQIRVPWIGSNQLTITE